MKRPWLILLAGLLAAVAGYAGFYLATTARGAAMRHGDATGLGWVKTEFGLSDAEFTRVCQLHAAYAPQCREMCRRIDRKNDEIQRLLGQSIRVTPAIEQALQEAARLRLECQTMMLKYFFEVSQTMPPDQGKRYLAEMEAQTLMTMPHTLTR
ncbi:MAG: periplasmic heavy metal sensor [Verrucomicrobia bacterium]|nr:periplasmic heavy metal sensor [Verrucomicrobiota bacterium]